MQIHDDILGTLGNTSLVRLRRFLPRGPLPAANIESFNPGSSVKDRIAPALGEPAGELPDDSVVVTLFPDSGERYLSKLNRTWMVEKGLLDSESGDLS